MVVEVEGGGVEATSICPEPHHARQIETNRDAKKAAFIAAYSVIGSVRRAAVAAKIATSTHYAWLQRDPAYVAAFDKARLLASVMLEEEARRRAVEGWDEPVYQNGQLVGAKRRYSDTLLIFLMKGNSPEKFGDKVEQTHRGDAESPVTLFELPRNGRELRDDA